MIRRFASRVAMSQAAASQRTHLLYQHNQALHVTKANVLFCRPLLPEASNGLSEAENVLFKAPGEAEHVVITDSTIFHAQGGGQPADTGRMEMKLAAGSSDPTASSDSPDPDNTSLFRVSAVRYGDGGRILHRGVFTNPDLPVFAAGAQVTQNIDSAMRNLHSRYHTAGHLIGLAVRHLATEREPSIVSNGAAAFREQKASHIPGDARVESAGLIAGEHRAEIQRLSNKYVRDNLAVSICFCDDMAQVRQKCGDNATKDMTITQDMRESGGMRIVEIEGLGGYPCGGTHLPLTGDVLGIVVTGIKRQKGVSKISYGVADSIPEEDR